jgi:hypothetical protein
MRIQEYIQALRNDKQITDVGHYLPSGARGTVLIGTNFNPIQDCGCLYTYMPTMGNVPPVVVTVMCDKHELGQLLADERARLEKAWAARGP